MLGKIILALAAILAGARKIFKQVEVFLYG